MIHIRCTQFFPPSLQETSNKGDNTINREWVKVGYNERKRESRWGFQINLFKIFYIYKKLKKITPHKHI